MRSGTVTGLVHRYAGPCAFWKLISDCTFIVASDFVAKTSAWQDTQDCKDEELAAAIYYIALTSRDLEVILDRRRSADPSPARVAEAKAALAAISHVKICGWHTRLTSRSDRAP